MRESNSTLWIGWRLVAVSCALLAAACATDGGGGSEPVLPQVQVNFNQPALSEEEAAVPSDEDGIGYESVAAARAALQARSDVEISYRKGWMQVRLKDSAHNELWTFTPPDHPAHPSVVRRISEKRAGSSPDITMNGRCEAERAACDELIALFRKQNALLTASGTGSRMMGIHQSPSGAAADIPPAAALMR